MPQIVFWESLATKAALQQRRIAHATVTELHVVSELRRRERAAALPCAPHVPFDGQGAAPVPGALRSTTWARASAAARPQIRDRCAVARSAVGAGRAACGAGPSQHSAHAYCR